CPRTGPGPAAGSAAAGPWPVLLFFLSLVACADRHAAFCRGGRGPLTAAVSLGAAPGSSLSSGSTMQVVDGDFTGAIQAHVDHGGARPRRGVALHPFVTPRAPAEKAR